MGRKALPKGDLVEDVADKNAVEGLSDGANALVQLNQEQNALVRATAATLGYALPADATDPDLIQRDIAANMRRSVEACLEVGKGLAVLKAACGHGNFIMRLDVLCMDRNVAIKFMQSATKFSNASTSKHLTDAIGNQSKLFEMLVLDDEQIDELANFGQTGELSLDAVATMSVKELRTAVRELKAEKSAGDAVRADLSKKIDKLQTQVKRIHAQAPDEKLVNVKKEAVSFYMDAQGLIVGQLRQALKALHEHGAEPVYMAGLVGQLLADMHKLRSEFDLPDVSNAADAQLAAEVAQWASA